MIRGRLELVAIPLRQLRRLAVGWGIGFGLLVALTVAFWPAFQESGGLTQAIEALPPPLVEAFGLENFGTPAGFLRGNLYELVVPLMLAIAAVAAANGVTAAEEDAGRLELYLSQPVGRAALFAGRAVAAAAWVAVVTVLILAVQLASDIAFGLDIEATRVVATVVLCGLLALLHGGLALAIAGWWPRPGSVLAAGVAVIVAGYVIAALFPLSEALKPLADLSPWKWALGGDPLTNPAEAWRYLVLAIPAVALALMGVAGFVRRDIRAA